LSKRSFLSWIAKISIYYILIFILKQARETCLSPRDAGEGVYPHFEALCDAVVSELVSPKSLLVFALLYSPQLLIPKNKT
jgi:hypothetical protein